MGTPSEPGSGAAGPGLSAIMGERRQLINLTYRLLGSLVEAEECRPENLRPLVRPITPATGSHRIPRRLADDGC
jgi:hypothetical protein